MSLANEIQGQLPVGGEFQGYTGDCTEYAYMVAVAAESGSACDKTELDRLTALAVANHFTTSPTGSMTAANLASFCQLEHTNYQQVSGGNMISTLTQNDYNKYAIVLQVLNGSKLPGNEGGVNGHAVCVLDYNEAAQTVTIANGDSVNGRNGQLDTITLGDVQNAVPFAVTIIEVTPVNALAKYFNQVSPTEWTLISNPQIVLHDGMLAYWQELDGLIGLPRASEDYSLQASYQGHTIAHQIFERAILLYDPDHVVTYQDGSQMCPPHAGACYLAHIDDPAMGLVPKAHNYELKLGEVSADQNTISLTYSIQ